MGDYRYFRERVDSPSLSLCLSASASASLSASLSLTFSCDRLGDDVAGRRRRQVVRVGGDHKGKVVRKQHMAVRVALHFPALSPKAHLFITHGPFLLL